MEREKDIKKQEDDKPNTIERAERAERQASEAEKRAADEAEKKVEQAIEESFPASDAPAWRGGAG